MRASFNDRNNLIMAAQTGDAAALSVCWRCAKLMRAAMRTSTAMRATLMMPFKNRYSSFLARSAG